ncbi:hypothetical protein CRM22_009396 [Opisthorchis felineus]|uniref:Uncharacterized protein n=1 Tax=Opisthorchis felineus TaxID=147828 RepID=A0A4S2L7T4_OPIFE|nr:hypothetical protein CRM22_009396 [Opisthorchis felineus]
MFTRTILTFVIFCYFASNVIQSFCVKNVHLVDVKRIQSYAGLTIELNQDLYSVGFSSTNEWDCALVGSRRKDKRGYIECCYMRRLPGDNWTDWARDSMILSGIFTSKVSGADYYPYRKEDWKYLDPDKLWT